MYNQYDAVYTNVVSRSFNECNMASLYLHEALEPIKMCRLLSAVCIEQLLYNVKR